MWLCHHGNLNLYNTEPCFVQYKALGLVKVWQEKGEYIHSQTTSRYHEILKLLIGWSVMVQVLPSNLKKKLF